MAICARSTTACLCSRMWATTSGLFQTAQLLECCLSRSHQNGTTTPNFMTTNSTSTSPNTLSRPMQTSCRRQAPAQSRSIIKCQSANLNFCSSKLTEFTSLATQNRPTLTWSTNRQWPKCSSGPKSTIQTKETRATSQS